jgi:DNA-binding CsgD family transcriptional regulator
MGSEAELLRLAVMAYEAATEPALWPVFLERYAQALNAEFAFLHLHDYASRRSQVIAASVGLTSPLQQSYHEHYSKLNLWRDRVRTVARTGSVLLEEEFCPRLLITRSEFYNDYLLPAGATRTMAVIIDRTGEQALSIPPMRKDRHEPFGKEDRDFLRILLPHLARANIIRERLAILRASQEVLDRLTFGVAFLTGRGKLLHANRPAESIFEKQDGLYVRGGQIGAQRPHDDQALRQGIARAAATPKHETEWPMPVLVARPSLLRSYQVLLAPLRGVFGQFASTLAPSVVAIITDPEKQIRVLPELLEHLYGLTRREAAVAAKLADGKSVEDLAHELGISYETARTHLRRIFDKTGTSRQSELVSRLARMQYQQPE